MNYAGKRFYPDVVVNEAKAVETVTQAMGLQGAPATKTTIREFRAALNEIIASEDEGGSSKDAATRAIARMAAA